MGNINCTSDDKDKSRILNFVFTEKQLKDNIMLPSEQFIYAQKQLNISDDNLSSCEKSVKKMAEQETQFVLIELLNGADLAEVKSLIPDKNRKTYQTKYNEQVTKLKSKNLTLRNLLFPDKSTGKVQENFVECSNNFDYYNLIIMIIIIIVIFMYFRSRKI